MNFDYLVGLTEEEARIKLWENVGEAYIFNVSSIDRIKLTPKTGGFVINRVNVRVKEGKVVEVIGIG